MPLNDSKFKFVNINILKLIYFINNNSKKISSANIGIFKEEIIILIYIKK